MTGTVGSNEEYTPPGGIVFISATLCHSRADGNDGAGGHDDRGDGGHDGKEAVGMTGNSW